jgi:hypothetical protein
VTRSAGELLSGAVGDVLNVFEQGDRHLWIVQDSVQVTAVDCDVLCRNADFAVIGGGALFVVVSVLKQNVVVSISMSSRCHK